MSAACTVWFYSPAKDRVTGLNVVNKIVAGLDPPFCHVELQFPSGEACSIVMQGAVTLRQRTFDREFYTGVLVRASDAAVRKALELAQAHVAADTRFGVFGGRTFCTKLVLDLLCHSGMLGESAPARSLVETPSALFRILQKIVQQKTFVSQPVAAISFADRSFATKTVDPRRSAVAFRSSPDKVNANSKSQKNNVPEDMRLLLVH